ncbi:MAG: hypothetical protein COT84_07190 [Chlamydiae bacterium CG10_big_fil_rev_8_21_14_0_10_35_9]|nr:MAG: hypothetical protein COT84_07190 [Chlamydiae bacterium CG10_big_fil_rev_8_21_14_0_10_35_9]
MKSERLKKLEVELQDLEQWLKLGLVPKKDTEKHKEEIRLLKEKIDEEKERLRFLKENGEIEEYVTPKKAPARQVYPEAHTLSDMDMGVEMTEAGFDMEEGYEETQAESTEFGEESTHFDDEEEEDPFSDKNRWKRGILEDPDSDNW